MTLNITVTTDRCIYQSADYRLYDANAHTVKDFWAHQKIFLVTAATWHASVCFNGVGKFNLLYVSEWLGERLAQTEDPRSLYKLP